MTSSRARIWWSTALIFGIVSVVGGCAHIFGWYQAYWFTDIILHTLSGGMLGLFWLGLSYKETFTSKTLLLLTVVMAGTFGSYIWEVWEFGGADLLPGIAISYVPDLGDSLGDIACGMLGAFIVGVYALLQRSKH